MNDYEHFMETLRKAGFQNEQAMHDLYMTSPVNSKMLCIAARTLCSALEALPDEVDITSLIRNLEAQAPTTAPGVTDSEEE